MTAPPLRPLSTGEILDVAWSLYRRHFIVLTAIAVVSQTLGLILAVYVQASGGILANLGLYAISLVVSSLCAAVGMGASTKIVADSYLGRRGTAGQALAWVLPHTGKLVMVTLLGTLAVSFGLFLLVLPGIIIACGIAVSASALVVEGISPMDALNRSWNLTRDHRGRVFAVLLVSVVLIYLVSMAAGLIAGVISTVVGQGTVVAVVMLVVVSALLTMLAYPFIYCAVTVLYYDLRVRKEGFDLEVLESQLATA